MANVTADQAPAGLISDPSAHAIAVAPFAGGNSGYTTHVIITQIGMRDGAGLLPTNPSGQGFDLWSGAGDAGASGRGGNNYRRVGAQHTTGGNGVDSILDSSGNQIIVVDPSNKAWYLYNTSNTDHVSSTSGPTNYERAAVLWSSNVMYMRAQNAGTGTARLFVPVTGSTTVASLPSASTAGTGARSFVTDATATTYLSTVAGGGANKVPVVSDGTNWLIG